MPEDPVDHGRLVDKRDQTQAATTPRTRQHVDPKRSGHEGCPRLAAGVTPRGFRGVRLTSRQATCGVEVQDAGTVPREDAVQHERVDVEVEIEGSPEPLNHRHRAATPVRFAAVTRASAQQADRNLGCDAWLSFRALVASLRPAEGQPPGLVGTPFVGLRCFVSEIRCLP